jgi:hypothetical protein
MGRRTYGEYLKLKELLACQVLESAKAGRPAHDELLFIVTDQTYELWFKQVLHELDAARAVVGAEFVNERDVGRALHYLERVIRIQDVLVDKLFVAATPPKGGAPTDTLTAAQSIARYPWHQPERLFALLDQFYAIPKGKTMRAVPYMPYLKFAPSAWMLPLKVTGGGYHAGGKAMFDSEGNLWVGNNFTVGWQGQDDLWQGNASKFAPNGKPLSPMTTGFAGCGSIEEHKPLGSCMTFSANAATAGVALCAFPIRNPHREAVDGTAARGATSEVRESPLS